MGLIPLQDRPKDVLNKFTLSPAKIRVCNKWGVLHFSGTPELSWDPGSRF